MTKLINREKRQRNRMIAFGMIGGVIAVVAVTVVVVVSLLTGNGDDDSSAREENRRSVGGLTKYPRRIRVMNGKTGSAVLKRLLLRWMRRLRKTVLSAVSARKPGKR